MLDLGTVRNLNVMRYLDWYFFANTLDLSMALGCHCQGNSRYRCKACKALPSSIAFS